MFTNRVEAARQLGAALRHLRDRAPVVLALPRGGVPIGFEVAAALHAPLDIVLVRKIGAPSQPELAVGAVVDGEHMEVVVNERILEATGTTRAYVQQEAARQLVEIERRRQRWLGHATRAPIAGRTVVVVDDGIATGATMRAALRGVRRHGPAHLVLAVPVAPPDTIETLRSEVDEVVCLLTPSPFGAVGAFYDDFRQVDDAEVQDLLERAARRVAAPRTPPV
jgi:putative phosphoribosyl transferase